MEKLAKKIKVKGTGISGLTSTLVKREEKKAIYLRSDGYYEAFKIKIQEAGEIFGREYPKKETYPNNEDFGSIGICTSSLKQAEQYYNNL